MSIRTQIAEALRLKIASLPEIKSATFDRVRLQTSDFAEWEIPAVQLIDLQETVTHELRRAKKSWNVIVELIMGDTSEKQYSQNDLWDLMEVVERSIFEKPNLQIAGVVHMKLIGTDTDLHLLSPFYLGRIELNIEYYQPLIGDC